MSIKKNKPIVANKVKKKTPASKTKTVISDVVITQNYLSDSTVKLFESISEGILQNSKACEANALVLENLLDKLSIKELPSAITINNCDDIKLAGVTCQLK